MERTKRREIFAELESYFRIRKQKEYEASSYMQIPEEALEAEKKARLNYWNYLRVGYQHFHK